MKFIPLLFLVTGCVAVHHYKYDIEMTYPESSNNLHFENDTFSITFKIEPKWIAFDIYNKSEEGLRINWDEVSISLNGKAQRIVHKETGALHLNETQPPTTIPPKSKLEDEIIPTDKIVVYQGLHFNDLFPISDGGSKVTRAKIESLKGQRIVILFPFYMKGQYVSYYYDLFIKDVGVHKPYSHKKT